MLQILEHFLKVVCMFFNDRNKIDLPNGSCSLQCELNLSCKLKTGETKPKRQAYLEYSSFINSRQSPKLEITCIWR